MDLEVPWEVFIQSWCILNFSSSWLSDWDEEMKCLVWTSRVWHRALQSRAGRALCCRLPPCERVVVADHANVLGSLAADEGNTDPNIFSSSFRIDNVRITMFFASSYINVLYTTFMLGYL